MCFSAFLTCFLSSGQCMPALALKSPGKGLSLRLSVRLPHFRWRCHCRPHGLLGLEGPVSSSLLWQSGRPLAFFGSLAFAGFLCIMVGRTLIHPQISGQFFDQGFDQGFGEGKNHEYSEQLYSALRKKLEESTKSVSKSCF